MNKDVQHHRAFLLISTVCPVPIVASILSTWQCRQCWYDKCNHDIPPKENSKILTNPNPNHRICDFGLHLSVDSSIENAVPLIFGQRKMNTSRNKGSRAILLTRKTISNKKENTFAQSFDYTITLIRIEKYMVQIRLIFNLLHSKMLCAKFGWYWNSGSGVKDFKNFVNIFSLFSPLFSFNSFV